MSISVFRRGHAIIVPRNFSPPPPIPTLNELMAKVEVFNEDDVYNVVKRLSDLPSGTRNKKKFAVAKTLKLFKAHPELLEFESEFGENFMYLLVEGKASFIAISLFLQDFHSHLFYAKSFWEVNALMLIMRSLSRRATRGGARKIFWKRQEAVKLMNDIMSKVALEADPKDAAEILKVRLTQDLPKVS